MDHLMEPIRVGDILPATLAEARRAGQVEGQKRALRKPRSDVPRHEPRGKTGRPLRLHAALMDVIAEKIEDGCPIEAAAVAAGVPASTYHSWAKRGREARAVIEAGATLDPKELIFLEFLERMEGARASAMEKAIVAHQRLAFGGEVLEVIETCKPDDPDVVLGRTIRFSKPDRMALEWYLERSHPHLFGTRRLEVTGVDGGPIPVEVEVSARDLLKKRLEQVATRLGEITEEAS